MNMASHNIKIQHETFGVLLNETFVNNTQFKLFLKMVQGCIELKNDLTLTDLDVEINFIEELIEEYQVMPNKTQKEWDNKQMLEIKLEQLKRKI